MTIDLNEASGQREFDLIPADTIVTLAIKVRGGGAGPDGTLRRSKDGRSEGLDLEFTVCDGKFAKHKLWTLLTLQGESEGHAEAGRIAAATLRAAACGRTIRARRQSNSVGLSPIWILTACASSPASASNPRRTATTPRTSLPR